MGGVRFPVRVQILTNNKMVIGFQKQFVEPILQGTKVHTIREDKAKRWKAGMLMHMYTGGRFSKEYHQFAQKQCVSIQRIDMYIEEEKGLPVLRVLFHSDEHTDIDFEAFAIRDGFDSPKDFVQYWINEIEQIPGERFEGVIIHWTDLKY